jgi:hypothetical protein
MRVLLFITCLNMLHGAQAQNWMEIQEVEKIKQCTVFVDFLKQFEDCAKLAIPRKCQHWSNDIVISLCENQQETAHYKELAHYWRTGLEGMDGVDPSGEYSFFS